MILITISLGGYLIHCPVYSFISYMLLRFWREKILQAQYRNSVYLLIPNDGTPLSSTAGQGTLSDVYHQAHAYLNSVKPFSEKCG